jgi:hypothetical protein
MFPDGGSGFQCHNPALGCASGLICGTGCDPVATGPCGGSSGASSGSSSSGGGSLRWYLSCGYPVCPANTDAGVHDAGACPPVGSACSTLNATCGAPNSCGQTLTCLASMPTMCAVSSRKFKNGIEYVDGAGLQELHDETLGIRLATYRYKRDIADPNPKHLGFIIEDQPAQSPAVDWSHDRTDMYGYLSMVVATMQVQEKEIRELRQELAETRADVCGSAPRRQGGP